MRVWKCLQRGGDLEESRLASDIPCNAVIAEWLHEVRDGSNVRTGQGNSEVEDGIIILSKAPFSAQRRCTCRLPCPCPRQPTSLVGRRKKVNLCESRWVNKEEHLDCNQWVHRIAPVHNKRHCAFARHQQREECSTSNDIAPRSKTLLNGKCFHKSPSDATICIVVRSFL